MLKKMFLKILWISITSFESNDITELLCILFHQDILLLNLDFAQAHRESPHYHTVICTKKIPQFALFDETCM